MIDIQITGLDGLEKALDPAEWAKRFDDGIWEASEALMNTTVHMPSVSARSNGYQEKGLPVDTGRMRAAVNRRKMQMFAAEVYVGTLYSKYVHDGTAKVPERPFFKWAIYDFGGMEKMQKAITDTLGGAIGITVV